MKKIVFLPLFVIILCYSCTLAQNSSNEPPRIYTYVEQMPSFPGDLYAYLAKHLTYPSLGRDENIGSRVFVKFVVTTSGAIEDIQVVKPLHQTLDSSVVQVIKAMPKWNPGMQNGKKVNCYISLPIIIEWE